MTMSRLYSSDRFSGPVDWFMSLIDRIFVGPAVKLGRWIEPYLPEPQDQDSSSARYHEQITSQGSISPISPANPTTGLPMCGALDASGSAYGEIR
jgi:hypothetical protein